MAVNVNVFGIIAVVRPIGGSLVFVLLLAFLLSLDIGIDRLGALAVRNQMDLIFEKLKKELMLLGIISFVVFIFEQAASNNFERTSLLRTVFVAFEMTHIIILFIGVSFIMQGIFLVSYASTAGKRYLNALRVSSDKLLKKYNRLSMGSWEYWWFHHGSMLLPAYPAFREDIEFKLIERLIIFQHRLSSEFNFANYVNSLFAVSCEQHKSSVCLVVIKYFI